MRFMFQSVRLQTVGFISRGVESSRFSRFGVSCSLFLVACGLELQAPVRFRVSGDFQNEC